MLESKLVISFFHLHLILCKQEATLDFLILFAMSQPPRNQDFCLKIMTGAN
jgi:hypothetical protein